MNLVFGCSGADGVGVGGRVGGGEETGAPTDGLPRETGGSGCEDRADVRSLAVEPLPRSPLGRRLRVSLDREAGVSVACWLRAAPPALEQLVPLQSRWRYLADGSDPGPAWAEPAFDDSSWPEGEAPFVSPEGGRTPLAVPPAVPAEIVRFRTTFQVADPDRIVELRTELRADDGAVLLVNGQEVHRDNVPVTAGAFGNDELVLEKARFTVPPGLLLAGINTLAVELHQLEGSTDAAFHLRLSAWVEQEAEGEVLLVESSGPATEHELGLFGLLPDATYECLARTDAACGDPAGAELRTEPLATAYPKLALDPRHTESSWGAWTLFNHQRPCVDDHDNRLVVVDDRGRPRWVHEIGMSAESSIDLESTLVGQDAVLWAGGQQPEGSPQLVGLDGEPRYTSSYPGSDQDIYHHDVERDSGGRLLGITESPVRGQTHRWMGWGLVEHDPATSEVTWRWASQEAFDRGELTPAAVGDYDPWHPNSLTSVSDADGQGVEVALLYSNEIVRVDRATGRVLWHLGPTGEFALLAPDGSPLPADQWFDGLHGLNRYGDLLYLYDNGWAAGRSRAVALRLDTAARTATLAWSWTEFGWYEKHWGDVDELPGGNVLITMARSCSRVSDHPGALVEVDPATQEVVWRLDFLDADDSTYRAEKVDGCRLFGHAGTCPAVAERLAALGW